MEYRGKYLLLMDEDYGTRELLRHGLARLGYIVVAVDGDEHALLAVRQAKYFAVFCNGGLREDSGLSFIQRLLAVDARLPCVALSGSANAVMSEAMQSLAAVERLAIPASATGQKRIVERASSKVVV